MKLFHLLYVIQRQLITERLMYLLTVVLKDFVFAS
jgi:hypothetical protein